MLEPILATKAKSIAIYLGISAPIASISPIFGFLGIDMAILSVWVGLMIMDYFLGTVIALWFSEFKSRTNQDRFGRKAILLMVILGLSYTGTIADPVAYLATTALMGFTFAELISFLRHCYTIYAKERLPEMDVIKIIFKGLIKTLEKKALSNK